ncbi:MAG: tRNA (cytidine(56)-2'-O)-methyltransferase [Candidatus Bathyarchaeia archaeon]
MDKWKVSVLRLNHRINRDKRVTTHLFLTARAFGVDETFYSGQKDEKIEENIKKVNESWGESFEPQYTKNYKETIKQWRESGGEIVHLTMYGLPIQDVIHKIRESPKNKLIVVGGAKVPRAIYELADWNVSVTSQPHSEISSLSVFLHELYEGRELFRTFEKAKIKIIPQDKGKKVVRLKL